MGILSVATRDLRLPQYGILCLAVVCGAHLGGISPIRLIHMPDAGILLLLLAIAWRGSTAYNDAYDTAIDRISNRHRHGWRTAEATRALRHIGAIASLISILGAVFLLPFGAATAVIAFVLINILYNVPPIRAKRIMWINTLLSTLGITAAAYSGALLGNGMAEVSLWRILWFVFLGSIIIGVKDFKDRVGDAHNGVQTFVTYYGIHRTRRLVSIAVGAFILSVASHGAPTLPPIAAIVAALAGGYLTAIILRNFARYAVALLTLPAIILCGIVLAISGY